MQLGALNSIIEVGIGLNLAFGVVKQFHERLSSHLKTVTIAASSKIEIHLTEALASEKISNEHMISEAISEAHELGAEFTTFAERHQDKIVVLATAATLGLLVALPIVAFSSGQNCDLYFLVGACALAVGPVGSWASILLAKYGAAHLSWAKPVGCTIRRFATPGGGPIHSIFHRRSSQIIYSAEKATTLGDAVPDLTGANLESADLSHANLDRANLYRADLSHAGIDEAKTSNMVTVGDNLQILFALQKSYANSIRLIYIDPPYNTGNDFIYKDDFAIDGDTYLHDTKQADGMWDNSANFRSRFLNRPWAPNFECLIGETMKNDFQNEPSRNLAITALFSSSAIRDALSASFVMRVAQVFFYQDQQRFRTNTANTMTFQALRALEAEPGSSWTRLGRSPEP